ncbi:MAG: MFS transporter [Oscillospiraceae bacterium]|nr:MFS transporter [Oscillospiraceae bacterium]
MAKEKKSFFDKLPPSLIKNDKVSIFPEGALGYLVGPTLALLANSILANYFNKYMSDVLHVNTWASAFFTWLPVISVIFVVIGNILVGRLMDNNTSRAGKARPLLLVSVPISLLALLFLFVFSPYSASGTEWHTGALVCIAIGYNLWFAFAYPMYYTPHAALVNLSTRNSGDRSLLATISNATALAAMGLSSMILPFFLDLLFVYQTTNLPEGAVAQEGGKYYTLDGVTLYDAQASYDHWKIFVIALIIITFVGALIEYFFTRERVTEEGGEGEKKAALPIGEQAKICFSDKFWIIMMIFFFLYQFGGMIKNVSQNYFCTSMFADASGNYTVAYGGTLQGTLSIIGAIPTAIGMVVALPLANKIGKGKAILCGAVLATAGGVLGMLFPQNFIIVVISFVIKALGSTPAMYLSLALLADILDHQEALHGNRTDGLSMTIYGAIMAGMTGLTTGVLNAVLSGVNYDVATLNTNEALRAAMPWLFIGGETLCYLVIFITFIFMKVERYSDLDHKAIVQDQAAQAKKEGRAFEMPKDEKPVAIDAALLKEYNELRKQNGRTEVKV